MLQEERYLEHKNVWMVDACQGEKGEVTLNVSRDGGRGHVPRCSYQVTFFSLQSLSLSNLVPNFCRLCHNCARQSGMGTAKYGFTQKYSLERTTNDTGVKKVNQ